MVFDQLTCRRGTGSYKWDIDKEADVIPLWVADMDFRTAPAVTQAVVERAASGIYGYVRVPDSYYDALEQWFLTRHGWEIDRESVIYTPGVVPALSAIIKALVKPGEGVILQTPAYNCFFSSVRNNEAVIVENPLRRVNYADGFSYEIDFDGLEALAANPKNRLMILCNPQNPTGRVWTPDELGRIHRICSKYGVKVVSDEIHCELVRNGAAYTPYATIDPEAIVCCSPSKAFNTAGLQIANIVCPDAELYALIDKAVNVNEVCDVNPFGVVALEAAYRHGAEWLEQLNEYLDSNLAYLRDFVSSRLPRIGMCRSEATYLAWADISAYGISADDFAEYLLRKARVRVSPGTMYGDPNYLRINYACPRPRLEEALRRIEDAVNAIDKA